MTAQQNPTKKRLSSKQKRFVEEYIKNLGHISNACKKVKINRSTFYEWKKETLFGKAFEDAIEEHNDAVQSRILKIALDGDKDMLKFWARNQMKHKGFSEKQELEIVNNSTRGFVAELNQAYEEYKENAKTSKDS